MSSDINHSAEEVCVCGCSSAQVVVIHENTYPPLSLPIFRDRQIHIILSWCGLLCMKFAFLPNTLKRLQALQLLVIEDEILSRHQKYFLSEILLNQHSNMKAQVCISKWLTEGCYTTLIRQTEARHTRFASDAMKPLFTEEDKQQTVQYCI